MGGGGNIYRIKHFENNPKNIHVHLFSMYSC